MDDVPGEVELCAQAKSDVGEDVGVFVDVVHGGGLSACQLQHQPQMQGDAVDLHKESDDGAGYVQLSVETVQETPDHLRRTQTGKLILHPAAGQLVSCVLFSYACSYSSLSRLLWSFPCKGHCHSSTKATGRNHPQ